MRNFTLIYIKESRAEIPWLKTVANAAPRTPQWKTTMETMSRIIFSTADMIMKTRGLLESPRLLSTPAYRL